MEIFINEIPDEGLHKSGEFPPSIFELSPDDRIRPLGPVSYDVHLHAFDGLISFYGSLRGSFDLQCGTCLEYNRYDAVFDSWDSDLDLEEGQRSFDLKQIVREDFLLLLPEHLRCDELIEDRVCPKADLVDRVGESSGDDDADGGNSDAWKALDDL